MKFTQIYVFHNYSQLQSWITPNLYGVSPTMWRSSQSTWKGLHFGVSSVTIAESDRKIQAPKLEPIFKFPKSCQLSKLCSSKTNGGVTPHKCTSLESAVLLLSSNASPSFIAHCVVELQLLKVPSSRSCLSRSGFNSFLLRSYHSSAP